MIRSCEQHLTKRALKDAFYFTYDRMRKYEGSWHVEQQVMFPDYVFLESDDGGRLAEELEQYRPFFTILEQQDTLIPVETEEEQFLQGLCGETHHFQMSRGYIRDGQTVVTEGPLRGKENLIRKIDRHKRTARVGMSETGRLREMQVGLEIVSKS